MTKNFSFTIFITALFVSACATNIQRVDLNSELWAVPLKQEGVSIRIYDSPGPGIYSPSMVVGSQGVLVAMAIEGATGPAKTPAIAPNTSELIANSLSKHLIAQGHLTISHSTGTKRSNSQYTDPVIRSQDERRFILKVSATYESLTYLPFAWSTYQYILRGSAAIVDSADEKIVWQSTCFIGIDHEDKTRQLSNAEVGTTDGNQKLNSIIDSTSQRCARELIAAFDGK